MGGKEVGLSVGDGAVVGVGEGSAVGVVGEASGVLVAVTPGVSCGVTNTSGVIVGIVARASVGWL